MSNSSYDPLARAIAALDRAHGQALPPAAADAWQEAQQALLEAQEERKAFMRVAHTAMALVETLDGYEDAIEQGDKPQIAALSNAGTIAEDALVDALNALHVLMAADADLNADVAYLAALDRFTDDEEEPKL